MPQMLRRGSDTRSAAHIHLAGLSVGSQCSAGAPDSPGPVAGLRSCSAVSSFARGAGGVSVAAEEARLAGKDIDSRRESGSTCIQHEHRSSGSIAVEDHTCEYPPGIAPYTPGLYAPACCCGWPHCCCTGVCVWAGGAH